MSRASGAFSVMPAAICLRTVVLPAFAGDRIRPRWPLPTGLMRLIRPLGQVLLVGLEVEHLVREDRDERVEVRAALGDLGLDPVDAVDPQQAPVLLLVLRLAGLAGDAVAGAQAEATDLRRGDVDVLRRGHDAVDAQEAEALVDDLEDPLGRAGLAVAIARLDGASGTTSSSFRTRSECSSSSWPSMSCSAASSRSSSIDFAWRSARFRPSSSASVGNGPV